MNFSVTDTNSSRTSEAALWPSTYISPLSNSTPCIRKDRISSKSLMRLSICLWKDRKSGSAGMPRSEERFSRNAETDFVCRLLLEKKNAADFEPLIWLNTGRLSVPFYIYGYRGREVTAPTRAEQRAYLERQGASYVMISGYVSQSVPELNALVRSYPGWLTMVFFLSVRRPP